MPYENASTISQLEEEIRNLKEEREADEELIAHLTAYIDQLESQLDIEPSNMQDIVFNKDIAFDDPDEIDWIDLRGEPINDVRTDW